MQVDEQYCFRNFSKTGAVLTGIFNRLLLFLLLFPASVNAQQLNYDEVSITANVARVGNTELSALVNDEELFLSVKDVFDYLKVKNSFTPGSDTLAGYLTNPKDIFLIDQVNNTITYNNASTVLKQNELISTGTGIYLKAFYFGKIFGLDCVFNFRNLSVALSVKADLPLLRVMQQELIRKNLNRLKEEKKPDTTIRRKFSFFQLGMADWMVTATQEKNTANYTRAGVALGGVLAGGEANVYTNYSSNQGFDPAQQYFKWRYVNNEHSALRQVILGRLSIPVISTLQGPVTGIQLSNRPTAYRRSFGTYTISNTTKPGWVVELYVDNVLVNYTKADASGFFTFEVPMMYGNSVVKLRYYGPSGEERSQEQMISVPFNFLPQRQFEYNIAAGNILGEQKNRFSKANFNYGVSRNLTVGGGMEYVSPTLSKKAFPFVTASVRLGSNTIVSAEQAQGVRTKGTLNYRTPKNLQLQLNYTKYQRGQNAVIVPYMEERSAVLSLPVRTKRFNSFTRLTYQHFLLPKGKSTNAELLISASAYKINSNFTTELVSYSNSLNIYSELSITCRLPLNVRFTPLIRYEYTGKKLSGIKTELEKTFFNNGAVNLTYEKNAITRSHLFGLGIRLNFSMVSSSFSALRNGHAATFVQSAGGSIIYDGRTNYKSFSKNFSVGKGALSVVAFLDLNNNGVRDSKEPAVPGLKFNINGGRVIQEEGGTISRVLELEAYRTYFLEVDSRSFDNLSWQVKSSTIAVETDPNHVKLIEVPVSVISEASGYVYMKTPKNLKGLGRMIVSFYSGDSLLIGKTLTEQDGFFSFMGLTPGSYVAVLDTGQLHLLNFEGTPASLSFTIAKSEEGVIADGFQFIVVSRKHQENEGRPVNVLQNLQDQFTDSVNLSNQRPVVEGKQEIRKDGKPLSNKKDDSTAYVQKKPVQIQQKSSGKRSQLKTGSMNANKNNAAKIDKRKRGSRHAVSASSKEPLSKKQSPVNKQIKPKNQYQKKHTEPSPEEQQKLLEQLQKLLKKARAQKPEMA